MRKGLTEKIDAIIEKEILKYSQHKLSTKNIVMMLLSNNFMSDENFDQLQPKYNVSKKEIRNYILKKLKSASLL